LKVLNLTILLDAIRDSPATEEAVTAGRGNDEVRVYVVISSRALVDRLLVGWTRHRPTSCNWEGRQQLFLSLHPRYVRPANAGSLISVVNVNCVGIVACTYRLGHPSSTGRRRRRQSRNQVRERFEARVDLLKVSHTQRALKRAHSGERHSPILTSSGHRCSGSEPSPHSFSVGLGSTAGDVSSLSNTVV
jgi:hypothetical protein